MLDLETFGTKPGSIVKTIGAVKFGNGKIIDRFYEIIDAADAQLHGLTMELSTMLWHMNQSEEIRAEMSKPGLPLVEVLMSFAAWIGEDTPIIWGNGVAFDNEILRAAYERAEIEVPWSWWNDRCYRTIKSLYKDVELVRIGTHHHALHDAESQAIHLMRMIDL